MANIYDKKNEEQIDKKLKAYERKDKMLDLVNPFRVLAGISDMKDKARDKIGKKNKK